MTFLFRRADRRCPANADALPSVALLVAAYNEEEVIANKLRNLASLDYPADRIESLVGLDAPSDSTAQRAVSRWPAIQVVGFPVRRGKLAVISDLAARTSAEILVFSDANTLLEPDCLRKLVRHFADPGVGAVCGELRLTSPGGKPPMESLYWRFEVGLKFLESRLNCVLGANGAVYAVRRSLFHPSPRWIIEDFQVPMEIRYAGYRVVYDPEAIGREEEAPSHAAEFRRKIRIGAGDYQTLLRNPRFLDPFQGMPTLAYFSHKVLRWLGPFFLLGAYGTSLWLASHSRFYAAVAAAQSLFYLLATAGIWARGRFAGVLAPAFYFVSMNVALLLGMIRLMSGRQRPIWSTTPRSAPENELPANAAGEPGRARKLS